MWKALVVLLIGCCLAQQTPRWETFRDLVAADPCALAIAAGGTDCAAGTALPVSQVTFYGDATAFPIVLRGRFLPATATYGLGFPGLDCSAGIDPLSQIIPVITTATTVHTLNFPAVAPFPTWFTAAAELESAPRKVCANVNGRNVYTGFAVARVSTCTTVGAPLRTCPQNAEPVGAALTPVTIAVRRAQDTCCAATFGTGVCINARQQACCGGIPYNPNSEKCCTFTSSQNIQVRRIAALDTPCPCSSTADCAMNGGETQCCLPSKYAELRLATTMAVGQCFNTTVHRCCNTGQRYDPGSQQCCAINGLQSLDTACPCGVDQDCWGGQTAGAPLNGAQAVPSTPSPRLTQLSCCKQTAPTPIEPERCSIYTNFPSGTGTVAPQRCNGRCIDTTYQICCNGLACRREFEQCCNATCCNLYVGTCGQGVRSGSVAGSRTNVLEFGLVFEQCTTVEQLSTVKSFWVFILPSFLLLGTLLVFALALVFVHKASAREFLVIEKMMIGFAVWAILLACPLYFAPVYKYGVVTVVVAVFEILVAAAPFKQLRILGVLVMGVLLLYLFDPFHGNHYLNLASGRTATGNPDPETAGVWYTTGKSYRTEAGAASDANHCVNWYGGYFRFDPLLQDFGRFSNPRITTFGYCGRGWVTTLLIVEGALLIVTCVLFLCSLLAAILPFKVAYDPIELEVRGTGSVLEYTR